MRDEDADTDSRRAIRDKWLERVVWAVTVLCGVGHRAGDQHQGDAAMIAAVLRWLFLLIADVAMSLIAWLLAPILPAFAIGRDHLPRWLAYFDTPDNALDGDLG